MPIDTNKNPLGGKPIEFKPGLNIIDFADINSKKKRWYNPTTWGQDDDLNDLIRYGFVYQGLDGNLYEVEPNSNLTEDALQNYAKLLRTRQLAAASNNQTNANLLRRLGINGAPAETPSYFDGWGDNAKSVFNAMVTNNSGYISLTGRKPPVNATSNTPSIQYKGQKYKSYFNALAANKDAHKNKKLYTLLSGISKDGILDDNKIDAFLRSKKSDLYSYLGMSNEDALDYRLPQISEDGLEVIPTEFDNKNSLSQLLYNNYMRTLNSDVFSNATDADFHNGYYMYKSPDHTFYIGRTRDDVYDEAGNLYTVDRPTEGLNSGKYVFTPKSLVYKKGGKMNYFQSGGLLNQQQVAREETAKQREVLKEAFQVAASGDIDSLQQILGIQTQEQFKLFIDLTTKISKQKDADPELATLAVKALQGLQQALSVKAARGAKLNYIKMLNGSCPEGYELSYYKVGGKVCKKCQKVQEACKGKKMEKGGESPIVTKFKNGRKCKK